MGHQRDAGAGRLTARRRDVIALTAGATVAWPLGAHGEQKPIPTIGFLSGGQNDPRSQTVDGLGQGLAKAGYVVGRNLNIEYRWAEGQFNRLPALAADLTSRRVALIATVTLPAAMAAKAASPMTPIVFVIGEDPVKAGLVASFNRPAGNATGVSDFINQIVAKRLELLQQAVPAAKLIGLLVNPNNPNTQADANEAGTAAKVLGLVLNVASDRELRAAFETLAQERADALVVNIDPFLVRAQDQIISSAAHYRLPAVYPLREFVDVGGLMSYSPDRLASWHQAGLYAARILNGENPADLPVQQASKIELTINLKTANALGLTVPQLLLARADEVIQ